MVSPNSNRCTDSRCDCSESRRCCSQVRCSGLSHAASFGRSVSSTQVTTHMMMGGSASIRNSHCQPCRPNAPSSVNSHADTGGPTISETTLADWKIPIMRER